tara:strand:+ start:130 stop:498 length:369 start_codon:yes stop_codon:yes gene_type:complete
MEKIDFEDLQFGLRCQRYSELIKEGGLDNLLKLMNEQTDSVYKEFQEAVKHTDERIKANSMYAALASVVANQVILRSIVFELKKEQSRETYYREIISDKEIDKLKALTKRVEELEEKNGKTN